MALSLLRLNFEHFKKAKAIQLTSITNLNLKLNTMGIIYKKNRIRTNPPGQTITIYFIAEDWVRIKNINDVD